MVLCIPAYRHVEVATAPHTKFLFSVALDPAMAKGTVGLNLMQVC